MKKTLIGLMTFLLFCVMNVVALDDELCKSNQDLIDIPCVLLTPDIMPDCNLTIEIILKTDNLGVFNNSFYGNTSRCYYNFTFTTIGIYSMNYSNGLTAQINLKGDNMQFFNLTVFGIMILFGLTLIILMHLFDDRFGVAMSLGSFGSVFFYIMAALIFFGFRPIFTTITIAGQNINIYIGMLCVMMGLYATIFSNRIYNFSKAKTDDYGQVYYGDKQ